MRGTLLGLLLVLFSASDGARAQSPRPPREFRFGHIAAIHGPRGGDWGQDLAVDADGSFFIVGTHSGLDLDGDGTVDLPAHGRGSAGGPGSDPLLVKLPPGGERATWVSTAAGDGLDFGTGVAPDGHGGAYMIGSVHGRMVFDTATRIGARGPSDGFLARYDAAGRPVWAIAVGGDRYDGLTDVAADSSGVVIVGAVGGPVDVDRDGTVDIGSSSGSILLVASFDAGGKLRWARGGANRGKVQAQAVAMDGDGSVFVTGQYQGSAADLDGDGRSDLPASPDGLQGFLAAFEAGGALSWVRRPAGALLGSVALAPNGDLLVLGVVPRGAADIDGDGRPDVEAPPGGQRMFLGRLTRSGRLVWLRPLAGAVVTKVASRGNRIVLGGLFRGRLDLDGDGTAEAVGYSDGHEDGMVAILRDDGSLEEVRGLVGISYDQVRAADFSPDGSSLYATGFVQRTVDADGDGHPEGDVKCDAFGDLVVVRYDAVAADCRPSMELELEDARSGAPLTADDATGVVSAGGRRWTADRQGSRLLVTLDRPGSYDVTVTKPGYATWRRAGVVVDARHCRDHPLRLAVRLVPEPAGHD